MSEVPKGLFAKLTDVMAEVGYVQKKGYNDFQKYKYVTEADLIDAVRDKLTERRVMLIPSAQEVTQNDSLVHVKMRFTFVDAESGETVQSDWYGSGADKGDKALYKAYTGALKYFLMKTFLIPTGDDPEADTGTDKPAAKPDRQLPERYVDWLRLAIRARDSKELADEVAWKRDIDAATSTDQKKALVERLEAVAADLDCDVEKLRERWTANKVQLERSA